MQDAGGTQHLAVQFPSKTERRSSLAAGRVMLLVVCGIAALGALGGCTTVTPEAVTEFRAGVTSTRRQLTETLVATNTVLREGAIEHVSRTERLSEEAYGTKMIAPAVIARWSNGMGMIEAYAAALESLTGGQAASGVESALGEVGQRLEAVSPNAVPDEAVPALQSLGGAIVRRLAASRAQEIAADVNPEVQAVFAAFIEGLGDVDTGLMGTITSTWDPRLGEIQRAFDDLVRFDRTEIAAGRPAQNSVARRELAALYLEGIEQRDAQYRAIAAVQSSLAVLADMHAALARGDNATVRGLLSLIRDEYDLFRERRKALEAMNATGG